MNHSPETNCSVSILVYSAEPGKCKQTCIVLFFIVTAWTEKTKLEPSRICLLLDKAISLKEDF